MIPVGVVEPVHLHLMPTTITAHVVQDILEEIVRPMCVIQNRV